MIKGTKKTDFKGKVLNIIHNNQKSPYLGERYGQDVEPSGYYCIQEESNFVPNGWEQKSIILNNPLIIDNSKDLTEWKRTLYKRHNAKNKALSSKLQSDGFDGIITLAKSGKYIGYTGEIIVFDIKKSEQKANRG
jgi:hypothetical protein